MRRMIERGVFALIVAALLQVLIAPGAGASTRWCPKDPYISVDGQLLHVWVASTYGIEGAASGPTSVRIGVPTGTIHELVGADDGFGQGYAIEFFESDELALTDEGVQIAVSVFVPATTELPVKLDLTTPDDGLLEWEIGATNDWIVATTGL